MAKAHDPGATTSVLGYVWLIGFFGLLGWATTQGLAAGRLAQIEIEKKQKTVEAEKLQGAMRHAFTLAGEGKFDEALALLHDISKEYPKLPAVWVNIAAAERERGQLSKSIEALDKALELTKTDDWEAVALKAAVLMDMKKTEEALALAETIPAHKGGMPVWLRADPSWSKLEATPRVIALRAKHGVTADGRGETGVRAEAEIQRQRAAFSEEELKKGEELRKAQQEQVKKVTP